MSTLEGEDWLMHHGFTQAEGVANLDGVPAAEIRQASAMRRRCAPAIGAAA